LAGGRGDGRRHCPPRRVSTPTTSSRTPRWRRAPGHRPPRRGPGGTGAGRARTL